MFHVARRKKLDEVVWATASAEQSATAGICVIEGRVAHESGGQYPSGIQGRVQDGVAVQTRLPTENERSRVGEQQQSVQRRYIRDDEVEAWLRDQTQSSTSPRAADVFPSSPKQQGFRLIVCDQSSRRPAGISVQRSTYEVIESAFQLSPATMSSFFNTSGVFSRRATYRSGRELESLTMVVKAKQKVHIGNWLLSLRHCFATGVTCAFLCGDGLLRREDLVGHAEVSVQMDHLMEILDASRSLWAHPLLLPSALLHVYCGRAEIERYRLADQLVELENDIGVTFAGRSGTNRSLMNWPDDIDVKAVTIGLHSSGKQILHQTQTCNWAKECAGFLIKIAGEIKEEMPRLRAVTEELEADLEHELSSITFIGQAMASKKDRIQAQLNVLYSAASQKQNSISIEYSRLAHLANELGRKDLELSTKIASSTKRDSVAMMTVTCITLVILPGTYISSLFSMNMFDWSDNEVNHHEVSSQFWIYWAITLPLTVFVMGGWYLWYRRADKAWQKETGFHLSGLNSSEESWSDGKSEKSDGHSGGEIPCR